MDDDAESTASSIPSSMDHFYLAYHYLKECKMKECAVDSESVGLQFQGVI